MRTIFVVSSSMSMFCRFSMGLIVSPSRTQ